MMEKATRGRREAIGIFGAFGITALTGCGGNGASVGGTDSSAPPPVTGEGGPGISDPGDDAGAGTVDASATQDATVDAAACTLTPEQEQGPYYVPFERIRNDITSNSDGTNEQPGVPLSLEITLVDATTCQPVANAAIDVWHCNADGLYSQFEENSGDVPFGASAVTCYEGKDDFLRGVQITNASGQVTFTTIFPGWYAGRAIHIHVIVHVGGSAADGGATYANGAGHVCHTGQLFFDEATTELVMQVAPYSARDVDDGGAETDAGMVYRTRNANDGVYTQESGSSCVLTLTGSGASGFVGRVTLAVDPTATPAAVNAGPSPVECLADGGNPNGGGHGGPGGPGPGGPGGH